jgi:Putative peptidoglycan binding domain/L,D-transpeptidase catalytic domain
LVLPAVLAAALLPVAASAAPTHAAASTRASAAARAAAPASAQLLAERHSHTLRHTLRYGMRGDSVKSLQRRLAALKYYPGPIDGQFGLDTQEAVWAFQEAHGLPGEDYVSSAMSRDLANPTQPRVLVPHGGANRIEINLKDEVLVLYKNNRPELISHISSGGGYYFCSPGGGCGYAITPTGNYHTLSFLPGWVTVPLGYMYNPVFFIGTSYAIHGDIPVPLQPVSHGCVRIPMDIAAFFHTLVQVPGEPVYVRG